MPIRSTNEVVYSEEFARVVVAAIKTNPAAALAVAPMVRLIQEESFSPTPATTLAEVVAVEADFTDYAEKALTMTEPANVGPDVEGAIGTVNFNMTTDPVVTQNTIYGYFIEATDVLVLTEMFATGQQVSMANVGDFLTLNVAIPFRDYQSIGA